MLSALALRWLGRARGVTIYRVNRAALYVRVSTDRQTVENQRGELLQLAHARGFEPVVYDEVESAAKARPVFDRMIAGDLCCFGISGTHRDRSRERPPHGSGVRC